jgi:dihydroorotase
MAAYVKAHLDMGCAGALAMPNTQPPVSHVSGVARADGWSIESYSAELRQAGAAAFEQLIVPLYLTRQTTAAMIHEGAASGVLRACKYYPPHGTPNASMAYQWMISSAVRCCGRWRSAASFSASMVNSMR